MDVNKYGLSRDIPDPLKRAVRQACGYGCVICGCAIYDYEHVSPPFAEAREHDPQHIALLCGACHDRKTRGLLSTDTVMLAMRSPFAKHEGFSKVSLDVAADSMVTVKIGETEFRGLRDILIVDDEPILSVSPPESQGTPPRINATFYSRSNELVARIVDNEWRGETSAFDIETQGNLITVRSKPRDIDLAMRVVSPHGVALERVSMCRNGKYIVGTAEQGFEFRTHDAAAVIPPGPRTIEKAPFWISVQNEEVLLGTGGGWRIRGAELAEVDPAQEGIEPPPGSPPGHKVLKITKLAMQGKSATVGLGVYWKTPQGPFVPVWPDVPCPCGSGKKFKDCHQPPGFFDF
jgi:hypothetical protein